MMNKKGFTLVEIIVVLVILAILAAFTIPTMLGYISSSQEKLCNVTRLDMVRLYKTSMIGKESSASKAGFKSFALENWGSLSQCPSGGVYTYNVTVGSGTDIKAEILCSKHGTTHVLTADEAAIQKKGYYAGTLGFGTPVTFYTGTATNIIIPNTLDGMLVKGIWQDFFKDKGLTSVTFQDDSEITRIHARAFQNNNLTEIVLPVNLKNLDVCAFYGNNITKITINANVIIEGNVFQNNNSFKTVYDTAGDTGGAGTYVFTTSAGWKKQ
ncbi:MAG: leucine-rich repeat protein [Acetobacterium sp.]